MNQKSVRQRLLNFAIAVFVFGTSATVTASSAWSQNINLFRPSYSWIAEGSEAVLRTAYLELGIDITVEPMPAQVALQRSLAGESDGEVHRVYALGEQTSVLIRVPTPIGNIVTVAVLAPGSGITIAEPEELANYRVGRVDGVLHAQMLAEGLENVQVFGDQAAMLDAVASGQIDVGLEDIVSMRLINAERSTEETFAISEPLQLIPFYHYLNERHADLVPRIDAVLSRMADDGALFAIRDVFEQEYLADNFD